MEIGNEPDFNNTHGEELFEYYVQIEGEVVTKGAGAVVTHAGAQDNETRWGSRHVCQKAYRRRLRYRIRIG